MPKSTPPTSFMIKLRIFFIGNFERFISSKNSQNTKKRIPKHRFQKHQNLTKFFHKKIKNKNRKSLDLRFLYVYLFNNKLIVLAIVSLA